jgi:hypothetical protein
VLSRDEMDHRARSGILSALFVAYALATAVHVGWVLAHEPFSFDAWNVALDTNAQPFSIGNLFGYWWQQYTESNPRLGQPLTYLGYKLELVAEIVLPLSLLALTLAVTTLGLGRLPWRHPRGLVMWAIAIGFAWFALPQLGRNLFSRAYGLNYVFGAAVQLWFLVPLRLSVARDASAPRLVAYAALGLAAGLCNEHTGPAIVALLVMLAWWHHRRSERPRLVWAGAAGYLVGFGAILFAPGQGSRYDGLAQKMSLVDRVLRRGIEDNLAIVGDYLRFAAPLLALIVIVAALSADSERRRAALRMAGIAVALGTFVAMTMFASPKLGTRFHYVGLALLLAAFVALVDATVSRARWLAPLVALALVASTYAAVRTIPLFARVSQQGAERMAELAATPPGGTYVADAWAQVEESWWFIGDDFRDYRKRELVARYFGLARVFFRGHHPGSPLGVTGIRLIPRYWTTGASSPADYEAFELVDKSYDVKVMHDSARSSIALLQRQLAGQTLERFDLEIVFAGERPALPREQLVLSRWHAGRFEAYVGRFVRRGKKSTRELALSAELAKQPLDIYVVLIGDRFEHVGRADAGKRLTFQPWGKGIYWALACDDKTCWVIAANPM